MKRYSRFVIHAAILSSLIAGAVVNSTATYAESTRVSAFNDVKGHWAEAEILRSVKDGYVKGYADGTFKPNAQVTRAEFLAMITRASKLSADGNGANFTDVPNTYWAADAIKLGNQMGFINEAEYNGSFKPNQAMTRGELAKWLSSGLAKANSDYAKALVDTKETIIPFTEFYKNGFTKAMLPYIAVARGAGIIGGFPDGSFGSNKTTSRAEVVAMLYRYLNVEAKDPSAYRDLNELREVGLTGTNVETLGSPNYGKNTIYLKDVIGKDINFKRGIATAKIKKYIVVDTKKVANRGIFTNMFLADYMKSIDFPGFFTFIQLEVNSKQDITSTNSFSQGIAKITGSRLSDEVISKYSLQSVPNTGNLGDFFKKGTIKTVWVSGMVSKGNDNTLIMTIEGTNTVFALN